MGKLLFKVMLAAGFRLSSRLYSVWNARVIPFYWLVLQTALGCAAGANTYARVVCFNSI